MLWNKKKIQKQLLDEFFFFFENRNVKHEELEVTEEIK